ncbi:MAG: hypothetical protein MUE96_05390 [Bacteroidia bacterium]|nr:hypothetical protein [Bacteroidia bacterium]
MIRSIISFCLAFVYLLLSLGAVAQIHYCGSKVSRIGLFETAATACSCAVLAKSDCCHEATVDFSFETQSTITTSTETPNPIAILPLGLYLANHQLPLFNETSKPTSQWHPPQYLRLPLLATWRI